MRVCVRICIYVHIFNVFVCISMLTRTSIVLFMLMLTIILISILIACTYIFNYLFMQMYV